MLNLPIRKGFTLIELMIVMTIIGLLAALALPQYQKYLLRARWAENVVLLADLKQAAAQCMQSRAQSPAPQPPCDSMAALSSENFLSTGYSIPASRYLAGATYSAGLITLSGTEKAGLCQVTMAPLASTGHVSWQATTSLTAGCTGADTGLY